MQLHNQNSAIEETEPGIPKTYVYDYRIREHGRGDQKWTIQRNWQHMTHKTTKSKAKTQKHNTICGDHYR